MRRSVGRLRFKPPSPAALGFCGEEFGGAVSSTASAAALERQWVHAPEAAEATLGAAGVSPGGRTKFRVMHFNALADCLARSAPRLGPKRGFRCEPEALKWEHRSALIRRELLRYDCDVMGVCEVDRFDDFFEPALDEEGFASTFRRKRSPAKDGVAIFWRRGRAQEALRKAVFLERGERRSPGAQVALMQRLLIEPAEPAGGAAETTEVAGRSVVICSTHLRASADDNFRMQQASEVVAALAEFSRGDPQIVLADVNSFAPSDADLGGSASTVFEYFQACGYRCAYRSVRQSMLRHSAGGGAEPLSLKPPDEPFPRYTTWAGWASGDFQAVCDHIFVSGNVHVSAVLDVPAEERFAMTFAERLPNHAYPSDHLSLVADVVI